MSTQALTIVENKKQIVSLISTDKFKSQLAAALMARLPEDYVVRAAIAMINSSPKVQECTPVSIASSVLLLAQAGLAPEPWKGHGWLIPRNQKVKRQGQPDTWVKVCTCLIGYKGYVALAYRSPEITKAGAYPVFEGDLFQLDLGGGLPPVHEPWIRPMPGREKRGELLGCYALAKLKNGETIVEWMTKEDIDAIRKRSASGDAGPWVTDYVAMARKTPFRSLFKWLPDADLQKIASMEEASELGHIDSTIDADTGEIITMVREEEESTAKAPVLQPQRMASNGEKTKITPCTACGEPAEVQGDSVRHVAEGEYDHKATLATGAVAAQAPSEVSREESAAAPTSEPATAETAAPQRELTYVKDPEAERPDPYHKTGNPQGKHISEAQHGRLWAILHSAQEKAKSSGGKVLTDKEFLEHVKSLGYQDARFIPKAPKDIYDGICAFAGGEALKMANGGK